MVVLDIFLTISPVMVGRVYVTDEQNSTKAQHDMKWHGIFLMRMKRKCINNTCYMKKKKRYFNGWNKQYGWNYGWINTCKRVWSTKNIPTCLSKDKIKLIKIYCMAKHSFYNSCFTNLWKRMWGRLCYKYPECLPFLTGDWNTQALSVSRGFLFYSPLKISQLGDSWLAPWNVTYVAGSTSVNGGFWSQTQPSAGERMTEWASGGVHFTTTLDSHLKEFVMVSISYNGYFVFVMQSTVK